MQVEDDCRADFSSFTWQSSFWVFLYPTSWFVFVIGMECFGKCKEIFVKFGQNTLHGFPLFMINTPLDNWGDAT